MNRSFRWLRHHLKTQPIKIAVMAAILLSSCGPEKHTYEPIDEYGPLHRMDIRQVQEERTYIDPELTPVQLTDDIKTVLYNPTWISVHSREMYVIDHGVHQVIRFSRDGDELMRYGNGKGEGPGEFIMPGPISVFDNTVCVNDSYARRVSLFDKSTGVLQSGFSTTSQPWRVMLSDRSTVVVMNIASDAVFSTYNLQGQELSRFGTIVNNQESRPFATVGLMTAHPKGGVLFMPSRASYLYHFNTMGEVVRLVETIDRIGFGGMKQIESATGQPAVIPVSNVLNSILVVDGGVIFIRTKTPELKEAGQSVFDRYDMEAGVYMNTLRFPFDIDHGTISDGRLYCIRDASVQAFEMEYE